MTSENKSSLEIGLLLKRSKRSNTNLLQNLSKLKIEEQWLVGDAAILNKPEEEEEGGV